MIKSFRVKSYTDNARVKINDSFNGQCVMNVDMVEGNRIKNHFCLYLDRANLRAILEEMDKDAQND